MAGIAAAASGEDPAVGALFQPQFAAMHIGRPIEERELGVREDAADVELTKRGSHAADENLLGTAGDRKTSDQSPRARADQSHGQRRSPDERPH